MVITRVIPPTHQQGNYRPESVLQWHPHHWPCPTAPLSNAHVSLRLVLSLFYFVLNFISERKSSSEWETRTMGAWHHRQELFLSFDLCWTMRGRKQRADINTLHHTLLHSGWKYYTHLAIFVITNRNHYNAGAPPRDIQYNGVRAAGCSLYQWLFRVELPHTFWGSRLRMWVDNGDFH